MRLIMRERRREKERKKERKRHPGGSYIIYNQPERRMRTEAIFARAVRYSSAEKSISTLSTANCNGTFFSRFKSAAPRVAQRRFSSSPLTAEVAKRGGKKEVGDAREKKRE